jgi:hypothetical protein
LSGTPPRIWCSSRRGNSRRRREQERRRIREERKARREARREEEPSATREFFAAEWQAALEDAARKRKRKRAKKIAKQDAAWAAEDLAEAEDEARRINDSFDPDPAQDPRPEPSQADRERPPYDWAEEEEPEAAGTEPAPVPEDAPPHPDWDGPWPEWKADPAPEPAGQQPRPDDPNVIDFQAYKRPDQPQEETVQNQNSETTSLNAALAYTQGMANEARAGVTSVETSIANLIAGGVTGPTITDLRQAMETLGQTAVFFENAHASLVRHIQVQESYAANPDAGKREFVKAD